MARPRRKTKKNKSMLRVIKTVVIAIFLIFLAVVAGQKTLYVFQHAQLFKIKEISLAPSLQFIQSHHLNRLKGKNIFSVNLRKVQRRLESQYPEVEKLRIIRQLPNRIYVTANKRDPFALLFSGERYIILDKKSVVLGISSKVLKNIPQISGVSLPSQVILGKPIRRHSVTMALRIIEQIKKNEYLQSYKITSIDMGNLSQILAYLNGRIKIILDEDKIDQKITKLGIFLSQGNIKDKNFSYIDLRFKEIYLGQKVEQ